MLSRGGGSQTFSTAATSPGYRSSKYAGPDVERLPLDPAGPEEGEEGRAVVLHVDPFPTVLPRAVHGEREVRDAGDREDGDRLLRVLVGPVVVHATADHDGQAVRLMVRVRNPIRARLARRVGALRVQRRVLPRGPRAALAVHLVRGDLE